MTCETGIPTSVLFTRNFSNSWARLIRDRPIVGKVFDLAKLRQGDILHVRRDGIMGALIRLAVGSWGNHDAIAVKMGGHWWVGDALHPQARLTPLADYEREIMAGVCQVVVYRPLSGTVEQGQAAAAWWKQHVIGSYYDWLAFPRLLLKSIVGDLFPWPSGWEWAWYCTEGVREAWRNATISAELPNGMDFWAKNNPTPRTTEKRAADGTLVEIACVRKPE
jgi:hypothetical protein